MVSLLDITPSAARNITVSVRGQDVGVNGLSIGHIAQLIQHFPEVKDLFSGKDVQFTLDDVLQKAPDLLYAVIVCGTGSSHREADALAVVKSLSIEEQTELLEAILAETFKGGLGPFVARVTRVLGLGSDAGTKELDTSGPKPPNP